MRECEKCCHYGDVKNNQYSTGYCMRPRMLDGRPLAVLAVYDRLGEPTEKDGPLSWWTFNGEHTRCGTDAEFFQEGPSDWETVHWEHGLPERRDACQ